jgi:ABC-type Na+ efflux pump permease subunit
MIHPRIALAIALKDLKDALRDGRVLLPLLMPLGLGLVYNVAMPDVQKPAITVAIASAGPTQLPDALRAVAGSSVDLTFKSLDSKAEVTSYVQSKKADVGLVLPAGFDEAVAAGSAPQLLLMRPSGTPTTGAIYVASALDGALRTMAGQHAPAIVSSDTVVLPRDSTSTMIDLGIRKYLVLGTLIMLIAMIAIYVLPILLTEEFEKKTADALLMVAGQADVVAAKVAVGLTYIAVSVPLLLIVTRLNVADVPLFAAGLALLSLTLLGVGLLLGALVRSVNQLNTWSGIPLLLVIMPVFFVGLGLPQWIQTAMSALPGSQAMKLLVDGLSGQRFYGDTWVSLLVIAVWAVAIYAALIRTLSRREV